MAIPDSKTRLRWPHRATSWQTDIGGYVVWRDVFEGNMRCTLAEAVKAHTVATFVTEDEATNYADYRNAMSEKYGTDDVNVIRFDA